jgi:rod shape-determining protein MreD
MTGNALQRLDRGFRRLVPFCLCLTLSLIAATPTRLPGFDMIMPALPLIGIFYWSIFRPDLIGWGSAFGLGLLNDLIAGAPLGISSLLFLLVREITVSRRRFFLSRPFSIAWWGFAIAAIGASLAQWVLVSLLAHNRIEGFGLIFETVLTILLYPPLCWLFARSQRSMLANA